MSTLLVIVYIILVLILVQSVDSAELNNVIDIKSPHMEIPLTNAFLQSKRHSLRNFVSNKNDVYNHGLLMENLFKKRAQRDISRQHSTTEPTLIQLEQVLSKFPMSKGKLLKKRDIHNSPGQGMKYRKIKDANKKRENDHKWFAWTNWSSCSVTCGKGREIRWRHCKENCKDVETEMEEKTCQLPACPEKLFGIIKL